MPARILSLVTSLAVLAAAEASARGQTLSIGDPAPPLTVAKWVKGDKIERLEPGKLYVVEFWATWCPPCRTSIPHLTKLQKKYSDQDVKFIGVSILENSPDDVEPFVKKMGDQMDYNVAMDQVPEGERSGKMAKVWMEAAGEHGIPTAFIINKDGKIAWIGHPMSMDEPLAKIVAGKWDLATAASERREAKAQQGKLVELSQKLNKPLRDRDYKTALAVLDAALEESPKLEPQVGMFKFNLLLQAEDADAAYDYGRKLVDSVLKDNANGLNAVAWGFVQPGRKGESTPRERKLALQAAQRANELTNDENPAVLNTLARAYFVSDEPAKAVETQERAIKLAEGDDEGMKQRLEQYRKAAHEKTEKP